MCKVTIYTTKFCGYCMRAKALLQSKGVAFDEIALDGDREGRIALMKKSGQHTVPQIWIGDTHVGGSEELMVLDRAGRLDAMLAAG